MARVHVLILRAAGTNCDRETEYAWQLAGATAERVHVRRLIAQPGLLGQCRILTLPGGFSYGDDIAAGRILAAQFERHLRDEVRRFVDAGGLVLGICNGFQVLVQAGMLPLAARGNGRVCTISYNEPPGFQDRWVNLRANTSRCAVLEEGREYEMPIAHAEGRVRIADAPTLAAVLRGGHAALTYAPPPADAGVAPGASYNPNGSTADIAGLCDESGRVLGLMPHPERFVVATQHPCWTRRRDAAGGEGAGDGLALFRRAVAYFK